MSTIKWTLLSLLVFSYNIDKVLVVKVSNVTQNAYNVIFERAQIVWFDKEVFDNCKLVTYKYNRTVASYNLTMALRIDLPAFKLAYKSFKFSDNEYKLTAFQFELNGCALIKFGKFGFNTLKTNSNFTECPIKKGIQTLYNAYIDSSTYPPHFPEGRWKFSLCVLINRKIASEQDYYIRVIYPVKHGRK